MQFWMRRRDVSSSQPRGTQVAANSSSAPAAAGQRLRPAAGVCQRLRVQILKMCDTAYFESLRYSTSSSTPWQLKPAPKEDIHQRPPGALPPRAACRTKRTKGLLRFPQSRSTAALQRRSSRSEERRVGKECRSRWSTDHEKKKTMAAGGMDSTTITGYSRDDNQRILSYK